MILIRIPEYTAKSTVSNMFLQNRKGNGVNDGREISLKWGKNMRKREIMRR